MDSAFEFGNEQMKKCRRIYIYIERERVIIYHTAIARADVDLRFLRCGHYIKA